MVKQHFRIKYISIRWYKQNGRFLEINSLLFVCVYVPTNNKYE